MAQSLESKAVWLGSKSTDSLGLNLLCLLLVSGVLGKLFNLPVTPFVTIKWMKVDYLS